MKRLRGNPMIFTLAGVVLSGLAFAVDRADFSKLERLKEEESTGLVCSVSLGRDVYLPKGNFRLFETEGGRILVLFKDEGKEVLRFLSSCEVVKEVSWGRKGASSVKRR